MNTRVCERCTWFEQCGQNTACEHYEPTFTDELESIALDDYMIDLQQRSEYYEELIDEQNT